MHADSHAGAPAVIDGRTSAIRSVITPLLDSPDDAGALALTLAQRVAPLAADNPLGAFGRLSSGGFGGPGGRMR